ncbi:uncharacterized protein LOC125038314 [Penaeus chinensis]|uniref:uncharacterized protein LOC125038314 n=1 Tax=Penaeus chinensis TaxID=139456 RepID=UPI001FB794C5|nr:uncharacterized protein LOC125038314 [Penaeus chinensis]
MAESLMGSSDSGDETPQFTEEEIEQAFSYFPTPEFWTDEDNLDMLQAILDFKFNAYPGSEFEADVEYYRNSRLVVYCLVCSNVELRSYEHFSTHVDGKPHKKKAARSGCEGTYTTLKTLTLLPISKAKMTYEEGTLEYELQRSSVPVIGMGFVFKEKFRGKMVYSCQLCIEPRLDHKEMFKHLTGNSHAMEYLAVKFQKKVSLANLSAERARVYECEGGVNFSIIDFTSHLPEGMQESCESGSTLSTPRVSRLSLKNRSKKD